MDYDAKARAEGLLGCVMLGFVFFFFASSR